MTCLECGVDFGREINSGHLPFNYGNFSHFFVTVVGRGVYTGCLVVWK